MSAPPPAGEALLTAVALLISSTAVAAPMDLPYTARTERLDTGLTLVMVQFPSPGLVAYYEVVGTGARDEVESGVTGFAHFFEHMMFRGTDAWPPARVSSVLKRAGADQNGFTTDDFTCYTFFGRADVLPEVVEMEADRFANLKYTEDVFRTEALAVLGEYNKGASSPSLPLREKLRGRVFSQHTYGHTTMGYLKDIEDMPNQYAYSRAFFERHYTPDNTTIVAVGDFDPDALLGLVKTHYGKWTRAKAPVVVTAEPKQAAEIRDHIDFPSPTLPMLSISWRTPETSYASKDTAIYNLLFELLFGTTSELYTKLVLEAQTVVGFSEWSWNHKDPYLFHVVAKLKAARHLQQVEDAIDDAVAALVDGQLSEARLDAVRSHVGYGALVDLVTPDQVALQIAFGIGSGGGVDALQQLLETIAEVTTEDIQRYANSYLTKQNRSVVSLVTKEVDK